MAGPAIKLRLETCKECGVVFERAPGRRQDTCQECKQKRVIEQLEQTHNKLGPRYELMVKRQLKFWRAEAKRLEIRA
jgi:hypothetical protein